MTAVQIHSELTEAEPQVSITYGGGLDGLDPGLLRTVENAGWVELTHEGVSCFNGSPAALAGLSFDAPSLAGEHPIERSIRLLTTQPTTDGPPANRRINPISG